MPSTFPFRLPGLDASSTEWVVFSMIWVAAGTLTLARFISLITGSLPARVATSASSMGLGAPGIGFVFLSILAHFTVIAALLADVIGPESVLVTLKSQIYTLLAPVGGVLAALLPPLSGVGRLHWAYLLVALGVVAASETLLRSALAAADSVRKHKQSGVLRDIAKKVAEKTAVSRLQN